MEVSPKESHRCLQDKKEWMPVGEKEKTWGRFTLAPGKANLYNLCISGTP